jgi:hypothetical protein
VSKGWPLQIGGHDAGQGMEGQVNVAGAQCREQGVVQVHADLKARRRPLAQELEAGRHEQLLGIQR